MALIIIATFVVTPLAWLVDLQISYAIVKWACAHDQRGLILMIPVFSLAVIGLSTWLLWSRWTKLRYVARADSGGEVDASYFVAVIGLLMNATFALLIVSSLAPRYFLSPCE